MPKSDLKQIAKEGIVRGIFWAVGVTIGFAFVSIVLLFVVSPFMRLPVIGQFIADIVYETQLNLQQRSPQTPSLKIQN